MIAGRMVLVCLALAVSLTTTTEQKKPAFCFDQPNGLDERVACTLQRTAELVGRLTALHNCRVDIALAEYDQAVTGRAHNKFPASCAEETALTKEINSEPEEGKQ